MNETTTTMPTIGVRAETQARLFGLLEVEATMGSDSLVNLALDAYEALREAQAEYGPMDMRPTSFNRFWRRLREVREGSHYCETA